jgi:hypothetical protein
MEFKAFPKISRFSREVVVTEKIDGTNGQIFIGKELVFTPRTDLGKRLYALRTKAVVSGIRLLSEEEVLDEVKRRRGELEEDEKDLY